MPVPNAGNSALVLPGWTLVHLLWQGLLVWLVCVIWLRAWRDRPPNYRYAISLGALLLLAIAPVVTVAWYHAAHQVPPATVVRNPVHSVDPGSVGDLHNPRPVLEAPYIAPSPLRSTIADYVAPATPWISLVWLIGLLAMGIWQLMVYGLAQRSVAVSFTPLPDLDPVVQRLSRRIGVRRHVRIGDSKLVNSPATLGAIHPIILLPHDMIAGLPSDQVELLLLHELAHIRRNDYFINLLQVAIEAVYFWHPVVWHLNRRVRIEREHCCDELAVNCSGEPLEYARALTIFEKLRMQVPALGQALAGGSLKDRIARLLQHRAEKLGPRGVAIPLISIVLTLSVTVFAVPLLASLVGDLRTLHELNHSNFTDQVYRVIGSTGNSDELARAGLQEIVSGALTDHTPSQEQMCRFAAAWEQHSTPRTLRPLIIAGASATDTRKWREGGFPYGSEKMIGQICTWLWITAQERSSSSSTDSRTCARAALLLSSHEPFNVGVQARRLLVELPFARLAQLDASQQQRLWRILGHANGVGERLNTEKQQIGLILDREDEAGGRLELSDARELASCITRTLRYTHQRPDIAACMASITRRLVVRFADRPELADLISGAARSPDADDLYQRWAQPLPPHETDPLNYIPILPRERRRHGGIEIYPAPRSGESSPTEPAK